MNTFSVSKEPRYDYVVEKGEKNALLPSGYEEEEVWKQVGEDYVVVLESPHGGWVITNVANKEEAIAKMRYFIQQAQEALVELRNLE